MFRNSHFWEHGNINFQNVHFSVMKNLKYHRSNHFILIRVVNIAVKTASHTDYSASLLYGYISDKLLDIFL